MSYPLKPDPRLDLVLERVIDAPRELLWRAWTTPEHVKQWFTPKPWMITDCEIDLRPGGLFRTRMQSPDGKEVNDRHCCYLEIVPNERLVWTDALLPGYRPSGEPFITAVISSSRMAGARATPPPPSIATRRPATITKRWVSSTVGARWPISLRSM